MGGGVKTSSRRYERMVIERLEWEAQQSGYHFRHHGNHNEKVIGHRRLPVDGYVKRHISLMVPMKHDTWSSNDVVLVQLVQVLVLLVGRVK
jgi:hypothetical protein